MKCVICNKREERLLLTFHAVEIDSFGIMVDQKLRICYQCLSFMIVSLIRQIDFHRENKKTGTVTPSISWARRVKMGKLSKDEMIDMLRKLNSIGTIKDFKEFNNEKET